jgi:hypothetical protein
MQHKYLIATRFQFRALLCSVLRIGTYIILSLLLISLSTLRCSIKKPTAPSWNTKLTIPLMSKHYDIPTLVEKINDPHLQVDSLGNPYFYFNEELDTIQIRENLTLSPVSKSFSDTLGTIELHPSETSDNIINLANIYPWGAGALPDTDFNVSLKVETVDFFTQATMQSGTATMTVENQLGIDLDSVVVNVVDSVTSSVVATFVFPNGILDTETDSQTSSLPPQTIHNQLYYDVYAHTPGDTIFTTSDKYMHLQLSINEAIISQGVAQIPSIALEKNDTLSFAPSKVIVDSATIKSGSILLGLNNFSNLEADVQVRLLDFTQVGEALTINRTIAGGRITNVNVPLDGYNFTPQVSRALRVKVSALTKSSGAELMAFNSSDSITLDASTTEIIFSRLSGTIPQTQVEIDTMNRKLDLPEGFENTQLTNAFLEIEISNGVDLPIDFSILMEGDNGKQLNINGHTEKGSATNPTRATIIDSNLSQFLNPVPENIFITGTALCGEENNQATITENDFVFARVKIISPLQFVMGTTDVQIESTSHELTDDVRDLLTKNLNWGKVVLNATNHLPLGASIKLYVSANQENLFTNPDLTIGPVSVVSGSVGEDGLVEEAAVSSNVVELSSEDMEVFKNRPFYIGGNLHFPGTNGEEVKVIGSDYLDVTTYLELEINNGD